MKSIGLSRGEKLIVDDKCFLVRKGKVITKDLLKNGKAIGHELFITKGEVIGNFFSAVERDETEPQEIISIEVEALEDTELEEIIMKNCCFNEDPYLKKILLQLEKRTLMKYYQELFDTKGYILAVLKLHAGKKRELNKSEVRFDRFNNISRSQFYKLYSELREEHYFYEEDKKIIKLNSLKINKYLKKFWA